MFEKQNGQLRMNIDVTEDFPQEDSSSPISEDIIADLSIDFVNNDDTEPVIGQNIVYQSKKDNTYYLTPKQVRFIMDKIQFDDVNRELSEYQEVIDTCLKCRKKSESDLFQIRTLEEFKQYISRIDPENNGQILYRIFSEYHSDGYTFAHRLCWNYAKERQKHRNPRLAKESLDILYYISNEYHKLFRSMMHKGTLDDEGNTPMHEYIRNITILKEEDYQFIESIKAKSINMKIRDQMGLNIFDYIYFKRIPHYIIYKIRKRQRQMKDLELALYEKLRIAFPESFHQCRECGCGIYMYQDLDYLPIESFMSVINEKDIWDLCKIIVLREKIQSIYSRWSFKSEQQFLVHNYCIHVWKRKILKLPVVTIPDQSSPSHQDA